VRREVAHDLLDGVQQHLVLSLSVLQRAGDHCGSDPDQAEDLIREGIDSAQSGLAALRELAAGIYPASLTHKGLATAVGELAARQPLPVAVDVTRERFPSALETSLYFVTAEALSNVARDTRATHASVSIGVERDYISLVVADDGWWGARVTPAGSALPGMVARVAAFAGSMSMRSDPHGGTTLRADVPWRASGESPGQPSLSQTWEGPDAPLSAAGERALILAAANGDPAARDRLVAVFQPKIAGLAREYEAGLDRVGDGAAILLEAARRYDPDLGTPFWPYAVWWIRRAMRPDR
jgi:hypothetical protein